MPATTPMHLLLAALATLLLSACQTMPQQAAGRAEPAASGTAGPAAQPLATAITAPPIAPPAAPMLAIPAAAPSTPGSPAAILADLRMAPDLWGRLRRGFAVPPLTHELVGAHARRFAANGFIAARADRVRLYLPLIVQELEQRRMPLELAMLPLVESALNPQARSPVGALGLWQFMAPTARRFELRTSRLVDDRKNLRQATRAAMDYLGKLHAQFGDWHLAMAAYNWGEGRVARAVARQRGNGLPADFNALAAFMPDETRNYVPQIMALALLVANPGALGASLPELPDGNPLVEVELAGDIDLSLALRMAEMKERDFLALNPAIRPPLVLAAATPRLLLPQDAGQRLERALAAHTGKTASWSLQRLPHTLHVEAIAARAGTSASAVREANDIPRGVKPLAGAALLLPIAAPAGSRADADLVATASLQTAPDTVKVYTQARARETLADVALRSSVALPHLAQWNAVPLKRANQKLKPGKTLMLWVLRDNAAAFLSSSPLPAKAQGLAVGSPRKGIK